MIKVKFKLIKNKFKPKYNRLFNYLKFNFASLLPFQNSTEKESIWIYYLFIFYISWSSLINI